MKSVLCRRYGGPEVLEIREVPRPVPRVGEVLVRVRAATVTSGDSRVRGARIPFGFRTLGRVALGFRGPRAGVLGMELCGDVVEVGAGVKSFRVGDAVIGFRGVKMGAHAEYVCMAEGGVLVRKPVGMTYEEGASIAFGGLTALYFVRDKAKVRAGQRVLVIGASGGVGVAAVQLARHFGAEVVGVCSAGNAALVLSLGAVRVVDYAREDALAEAGAYDVIVNAVGNPAWSRCKRALRAGGVCAYIDGGPAQIGLALWTWIVGGKRRAVAGVSSERAEDLRELVRIIEGGGLRAVVGRVFPLEEIAAAHAYVDLGHKRGSVVVRVCGEG